ncbi:MAG: hypothetical protein RLZZ350_1739 [Verrucomicrobiota bacterium]|jgi:flagellar basal body-associated protein FliL
MSDFKFTCPLCNQHITGDDALRGQKIPCPGCAAEITVPKPFTAEDAEDESSGEHDETRQLPSHQRVRAELAARLAAEQPAAAPAPAEKGLGGALKSLVLTVLIWVVVLSAALGVVWQFARHSGQRAANEKQAAEQAALAALQKKDSPELQAADKLVRDEMFAVVEAKKKYQAAVKAQADLKRSLRGQTLDTTAQAEADGKVKIADAEVDAASDTMMKAYKSFDAQIEDYKKLGGTIDYRAKLP